MNIEPKDVNIDDMFWVTYAELLEICRMYPVNIKTVYGMGYMWIGGVKK